MEAAKSPDLPPPRRSRRWLKYTVGILLVVVSLIAALPFWLNTSGGREWLLKRANATLRPGRLEVERFSFSWFRPTRMTGFIIRDPQGDAVVSAPVALWDRNLFQILFQRTRLGTLRLDRGSLDIERREDGSIDLVDALKPVLGGTPATDFKFVIEEGSIRVRSPDLADPIQGETFDFELIRPPAPDSVTWKALLSNQGRSLRIAGSYARWDGHENGQSDIQLDLTPGSWPLAVVVRGDRVESVLDGAIHVERNNLRWSTNGNAIGLFQGGMTRVGIDSPEVKIDARWSVSQTDRGWEVGDLSAKLPFATLNASGQMPPKDGESGKIVGTIDLPSLTRTFPDLIPLREGVLLDRGEADFQVSAANDASGRMWTATASLEHIEGRFGEQPIVLREAAKISVNARESSGSFVLDSARIDTSFLKAEGKGDLDQGIDVTGEIDLSGLTRQLGDYIDLGTWVIEGRGTLGAKVRRDGETIHANGNVVVDKAEIGPKGDALDVSGLKLEGSLRTANATTRTRTKWDATIAVDSASRAGLTLGKALLALHRTETGALAIDVLDSTLNGGRLHILSEYEPGATPTLRLKAGTELIDAEVNEEASRRVLSFIAPVLGGATRASGRVSATIQEGDFPLGKDATRKAHVEGKVVFKDLQFSPGPVTSELLALVGRSESIIRLDQPVVLSIDEGRVHQSGLSIPVGNLARIEVEGDVGFDRSLDLVATIPFNSGLFPNNPVLAEVAAGARITVPIGGTLNRPQVDQDAFRTEMARMGRDAAMRAGAGLLFKALTKPRDPNAPPPLTPAERKAKRLEKKLEKRGMM